MIVMWGFHPLGLPAELTVQYMHNLKLFQNTSRRYCEVAIYSFIYSYSPAYNSALPDSAVPLPLCIVNPPAQVPSRIGLPVGN